MNQVGRDRRRFLSGTAGSGLVLISSAARGEGIATKGKADDVPPTEDLMREHGILRRVLLVYDEGARRIAAAADATAMSVLGAAANIVHRFVEGYHEKLEEEFVFPKLEKGGKLTELTKVLRVQHVAGRKLTEAIMRGAKGGKAATPEQRRSLVVDIQSFGRMYAPHAAWEDTELFPVYREQFTEAEFDKLGDRFEDQEHKLLGGGGFEGSLQEVRDLEKTLGINDLARFTPR